MKKIVAELRKFNKVIAISLPVVLSIFLVRMQSLAHQELSPPECRVKKWDIPVSLTAENQNAFIQKQKSLLIQRLPVTCCQGDTSCLDELLYGEIPDKKALLSAIARSLQYLQTANTAAAYQNYQVAGITRDRIIKSLKRFRELLLTTNSATELHQATLREFVLYQSVGKDTKGSVLFTAYYGALALIRASIPFANPTGKMEERIVSRYVLDQDTGGAIKGAGRVDYFLGTGKLAGDRAGVTVSNGQLFYLLLKSKN